MYILQCSSHSNSHVLKILGQNCSFCQLERLIKKLIVLIWCSSNNTSVRSLSLFYQTSRESTRSHTIKCLVLCTNDSKPAREAVIKENGRCKICPIPSTLILIEMAVHEDIKKDEDIFEFCGPTSGWNACLIWLRKWCRVSPLFAQAIL